VASPTRGFRSTRNLGTLFLPEGPGIGGLVVLSGKAPWSFRSGVPLLGGGCVPRYSAVVGSNCQRNYFSRPVREVGWGPSLDPVFPEACSGARIHFCGLGRPPATQKASLFVTLTSMWNCLLTFFRICPGEQRPTVVGMETRDLNLKDPRMKTFGTIDGGLELMNAAWPARCQAFAVRREAGESWLWLIFCSLWLGWLWSRERLSVSSGTRCFRCRCTCIRPWCDSVFYGP
jgi:hypothetical protein